MNTILVSNYLDLDQDRHSVGPDLVLNSLQRLRANSHGPLANLHIDAGSVEPLLFAFVISTEISCAGSYVVNFNDNCKTD